MLVVDLIQPPILVHQRPQTCPRLPAEVVREIEVVEWTAVRACVASVSCLLLPEEMVQNLVRAYEMAEELEVDLS